MSKRNSVSSGVGRRKVTESPPRLAGHTGDAIVMLDDAVEEDRQKTAVHQSRRPFVDQREDDPATGLLGVEVIEGVLGKARVVGADVGGVAEVYATRIVVDLADSGRAVGGRRGGQLALPFAELRQHDVHRRVRVFEGQQQGAQAPHGARGGHGLVERRLAEFGVTAARRCGCGRPLTHSAAPTLVSAGSARLFRRYRFLGNLYSVTIVLPTVWVTVSPRKAGSDGES